ncbi:MAG: hypothetical protein U0T75_07925 [Chitinophagales bacterium]
MKNAFILLGLVAMVLTACNNSMRSDAPVNQVKLITHKEATDTMRIAGIDSSQIDSLTALIEYGYLPDEKATPLLHALNYKQLISSRDSRVYFGFYGADRYKIEFYIEEAKPDETNPYLIHLKGKNKYKKAITPFEGSITIDSVFGFKDLTYDYQDFLQYEASDSGARFEGDTTLQTYHLKGKFTLKEEQRKNAGEFNGNFYMDVYPTMVYEGDEQHPGYEIWFNTNNETRRGGFLFDGSWISYQTATTKPLLLARDVFMFGNDVLENFSYGEREIEINPKYRALGWEDYWENDEWWNDGKDIKTLTILF